jgi:hypothetical protein
MLPGTLSANGWKKTGETCENAIQKAEMPMLFFKRKRSYMNL